MERCPSGGEGLVLLAAAAAISLAQGRSTEELECLSALFSVLGDQLALIAVQRGQSESASQG